MATRCEYLTARCPFGCEVWLHPRAVGPHADRCRGHPWTDDRLPVRQVILADDDVERAGRLCPPGTVHRPTFSGDRLLKPKVGMYLRANLVSGIVVESPLESVTGRRWWTVVRAAEERGLSTDAARDPVAFVHLEQQLGLAGHFVRCDICGDDVTERRLANHRRANSVCRFLADSAEVRTFWNLGYRDPYCVREQGVPITWTDLNGRAAWRNRLHVVRFRLWTAVLLRVDSDTSRGPDHSSQAAPK